MRMECRPPLVDSRRRGGAFAPFLESTTNAAMSISDFWCFVMTRYAHRNARGELIRGVRRMVSEGVDPEERMASADLRIRREVHGLRLEFGRKIAREFGTGTPQDMAPGFPANDW